MSRSCFLISGYVHKLAIKKQISIPVGILHLIVKYYDIWHDIINEIKELGFNKITIIEKETSQAIATSSIIDIPSIYLLNNKLINETQHLFHIWKNENSKYFYFFGNKYNIIKRLKNQSLTYIISTNTENENIGCIAIRFHSILMVTTFKYKRNIKYVKPKYDTKLPIEYSCILVHHIYSFHIHYISQKILILSI